MPKKLNVHVNTMDAVLEFAIETKATGKQLYDLVTRTLGIREVWYFGLMYTDVKGFHTWLRYDKKVIDQGVSKDSTVSFRLSAKFYPEDVSQLVMEITLHFFYMQAKDDILVEKIHCSPEASLLLASYALQAEYGPYEKELHPPGLFAHQKLLPQNVVEQFDLTPEQWEGQTIDWWCKYGNMLRMEAELEYLKIAQDLDMYGVNYFDITNKKGTQLWLGVDACGLNIYNKDNKISPKISFPWGEIRNVEYHGKKFYIMPEDKNSPDFIFYVSKSKISDLIMQLCVGNHDLYLKRRKVDTMELQQMKAHAKDERARKMTERDKLEREKAAKHELERQKMELEKRLLISQEQARVAYQKQLDAENKARILSERVKMAEEETRTLLRKKLDNDEEMRKIKTIAMKSEEDKMAMQRKVNQVEEKAANLLMSSQQTKQERDELKRKLLKAESTEQYPASNRSTEQYPASNRSTDQYPASNRSIEQYTPSNRSTEQYTPSNRSTEQYPASNRSIDQYPASNRIHLSSSLSPSPPTVTATSSTENIIDTIGNGSVDKSSTVEGYTDIDGRGLHMSNSYKRDITSLRDTTGLTDSYKRDTTGLSDSSSSNSKVYSGGEIDPDDLMRQLEKENRNYHEQKQFISKQLSALKTQMYDLRKEEGMNGASIGVQNGEDPPLENNNMIHVSLVRQTSHKHVAYNQSKSGSTKSRIEFFEEL